LTRGQEPPYALGGMLFLPLLPAQAAEVTELPSRFRGDVAIGYRYDHEHSFLHERTEIVGSVTAEDHVLTYTGTFAPWDGVAVWVEVPQYASQQIAYSDTHVMMFDPNEETGTMVGTDEDPAPPTISGAGPGGLWIGAKGTPFSQTLFPRRSDRITMLLELGYRFADRTNFFTTIEEGHRGGGPGGAAWRVGAAFSTTHRATDPYLKVTYEQNLAIVQDVKDETGAVLSSDARVDPADDLEALAGAQVRTFRNDASGAGLDLDFFLRVGYSTWQDVPSGIYLPSVVAPSYGQVVTQSDMLYARGGLGVDWRIFEYLEWDVAGEAGTRSAHRLEYPYDVATGVDSFDYAITTSITIRIRDPKPAIKTI
jgi:hypothetical protein